MTCNTGLYVGSNERTIRLRTGPPDGIGHARFMVSTGTSAAKLLAKAAEVLEPSAFCELWDCLLAAGDDVPPKLGTPTAPALR